MKPVLLVHLAATLVMVGVIWFVQVVHYPLFAKVSLEGLALYSKAHSRLTTYVVGPPMLLEVATAVVLVFYRPEGVPLVAVLAGLALVTLIWLSSALLQAPRHGALGRGFDEKTWTGLVLSNWIHTGAWSARDLLVLWMATRVSG